MKIKFISLAIFLALAVSVQAQLYVNLQAGYAMPSSIAAFDLNDINASSTNFTETQVRSTIGGGVIPALTVGYMINDNLGVELTGAYLIGSTTSATATVQTPLGDVVNMLDRSTQQIRVSPTLVVKGSGETLKPYAKFGALLPVAGQTTSEVVASEVVSNEAIVRDEYTAETQGKISIGLHGAFGGEYAVSDNISIFGELAFQSLSIQGKSSEIVAFTRNGTDILDQLPASTKMINYVDEITPASNNAERGANFNPLEASDELRPVSQYGNFGVNFGISVKL